MEEEQERKRYWSIVTLCRDYLVDSGRSFEELLEELDNDLYEK